jgi:(p)ppGpp synthase/HD superfamily hydrolase
MEIKGSKIMKTSYNCQPQIEWILKQHTDTNHMYDKYLPYEFHLRMVVEVFKKFSHLITYENDLPAAQLGAWGHDLIEDTRCSYNDVKQHLGEQAADIVYALTNEKGKNRKERANEKYYDGIRTTPYAVFVKLCDRIANAQYSKMSGSRQHSMYKEENAAFMISLGYHEGHEYQEMFDYLVSLFNEA